MGVKAVDFRVDRTLGPRLIASTRDPDLKVLLRSKVTAGPLAPARISAPPNWDGICFHKVEAKKTIITVRIPGRYVWNGIMWEWREEVNMNNDRPGMQPGETEEAYDIRIAVEAERAGTDIETHKANIARQTGESTPPAAEPIG